MINQPISSKFYLSFCEELKGLVHWMIRKKNFKKKIYIVGMTMKVVKINLYNLFICACNEKVRLVDPYQLYTC